MCQLAQVRKRRNIYYHFPTISDVSVFIVNIIYQCPQYSNSSKYRWNLDRNIIEDKCRKAFYNLCIFGLFID